MTITEEKRESQTEQDITQPGKKHIAKQVQQTSVSSLKRPFLQETEEYDIQQIKYVKQECEQVTRKKQARFSLCPPINTIL